MWKFLYLAIRRTEVGLKNGACPVAFHECLVFSFEKRKTSFSPLDFDLEESQLTHAPTLYGIEIILHSRKSCVIMSHFKSSLPFVSSAIVTDEKRFQKSPRNSGYFGYLCRFPKCCQRQLFYYHKSNYPETTTKEDTLRGSLGEFQMTRSNILRLIFPSTWGH